VAVTVLVVTVPENPVFYSLYADGIFEHKEFDRDARANLFFYAENALVVLYYTYPAYREACVIRDTRDGGKLLPGLSKKVDVLFTVRASKVDKLRRAFAFLRKNVSGAYTRDDGFYIRLYFIILRRGKINYAALNRLALNSSQA
jgi:hypothetical protein